ncbi:MAG: DUF861 domain-containing protein [Acidobacteria bacterium]|nr:DUF861 domain-containing protein [Acidobacteriota bacterium]
MKRRALIILCAALLGSSMMAASDETVRPAKISKPDLGGKIFDRPDVVEQTHADGHMTQTATSLVSSDGSFSSGMYRSRKTRIEVTQPYGVDEFMYFLEGGVTLTSSDGTELVINAGDAVTVPREWTGVFETDGYTKIWVIYSPRD